MKIKYIGEPSIRYGTTHLNTGDTIDLPDGVAGDLVKTKDWELAAKKTVKKVAKKASKKSEELKTESES